MLPVATVPATSHFWADWDPVSAAPNVIRRDTRIFWSPQVRGDIGHCVGTFVGENPGSALSVHGLKYTGRSPIQQSSRRPGDPTLRLLLEAWRHSLVLGGMTPADTDYLEVLNTYYFRNPSSGAALPAWRSMGGPRIYSPAVSSGSRFAILGWGKSHTYNPEAGDAINHLVTLARVIIPDARGVCTAVLGSSLAHPLVPGPVAPSYILNKSKTLKGPYVSNVAREML